MEPSQHVEKHFSGDETVRDVVIDMADGITVPFALAAGISGAISSLHIIVTSIIATLFSLAVFGFVKGHFTDVSKIKSAWRTALIGSLAAGVAFPIAEAIA